MKSWVLGLGLLLSFAVQAGERAVFIDVSRQLADFDGLESLLAEARPWLNDQELHEVREFIADRRLTEPSPGGVGLIHRTRVSGITLEDATRFLAGPATGSGGYAASFRSSTPQHEQQGPGGTLARDARLPGIPIYFSSDARGVVLSERVVMTWIEGRAAQGFSIHVITPGPGGVDFIEIGFYIAEARAKTLLDVPGALAVRIAEKTFGRPVQRFASRQIAEIHMERMNISHSVAARINRGQCLRALLPSDSERKQLVATNNAMR